MKEYILNDIEVLTQDSLIKKSQDIFKTLPITHIPIVHKGVLVGCISESDSQNIEENSSCISEYPHLIDFFFTDENTQILKLIKLFTNNQTNIMPVLNDKKKYVGYYELNDILEMFSASPFLFNEGVSIVVEKNKKDFSISEVSQIVESNDGKILGLYISSEISDTMQVTIKINSEDINEIIQTFRRYNYNVISEHKDDFYLQDLKDRSDYLQKYLDM
jgi:predicted transcriptional regulator